MTLKNTLIWNLSQLKYFKFSISIEESSNRIIRGKNESENGFRWHARVTLDISDHGCDHVQVPGAHNGRNGAVKLISASPRMTNSK